MCACGELVAGKAVGFLLHVHVCDLSRKQSAVVTIGFVLS